MDIQLPVKEKFVNAHIALPASGRGAGLLLLHAWWGFNPFFKNFCALLAEQGYVVLAPDMNNGVIAKSVDEAKALMEQRDFDFMDEIILAAKDFLLAYPACTSKKLGVVGFSMGAAWSMVVAARAPEQVAATVLFYGGTGVDISKIQSKVLGHFSDVDEWESLDDVQILEKELLAAGVDVTFHMYPGQPHWFMENDRPEYNSEAAGLAWERTCAFLKENL